MAKRTAKEKKSQLTNRNGGDLPEVAYVQWSASDKTDRFLRADDNTLGACEDAGDDWVVGEYRLVRRVTMSKDPRVTLTEVK